ncbi:MAG TPA: hypothetical protein DCY48_00995 [Candidatus Magasanikbacteria bacterium]|nr:MAG: hypothetical protein A3I74_01915 [Candidatus Magasanikbacteria bacterium RIFCSPLOWO2_02_FULL_47_16]OGH79822.1 MAG: hypothetical protein A3C10_05175 [Candidatus Magasanikbacteria bacterium RIFCSPHIGHO2_02_FULL_48_18]OGH83044.1 MAG: hypothetical protein A3G08_01350 [Candidatus Magasanikbacteria bacterium RIFCSPLOWO2_12_FULL_47_9b]HAZ28337.1 hypothetical protein [Candidatus Magasanikbacteria bacterium]
MAERTKKNVVVIGGGNGAAISLCALKEFREEVNMSAVISMSDSGGSSGLLRKEFGALPVGDIMRAILAMSPYDHVVLKKIFYRNRFSGAGKLDGHNIGNLFLVLSEQYGHDFDASLRALHQAVEALGVVHPVTFESSDLCVELSNGEIIINEHEIDRPTHSREHHIVRAWLQPTPSLSQGAKQAIEEADVLIFGPGSLYCSIIASLVVEGLSDAIAKNTDATLMYVVGNAYEKIGEAGPSKLCDFIKTLQSYLPRPLDRIIYNNHQLTHRELLHYEEKGWEPISYNATRCEGYPVIAGDFEKSAGGLCPQKLAPLFYSCIFS